MKNHTHRFKFDCDMNNLHIHKVAGIVERTYGFGGLHFHYYSGVSSYMNHTHYFSGITGLPIKTENGHIHRMEGLLESNPDHEHKFKGETSEEISYIKGPLKGEAYI